MTELYEYTRLPPRLAVTCPVCGAEARFLSRAGTFLPVRLAADVDADGRAPLSWDGTLSCPPCGVSCAHRLNWPADAFYRVEHRGAVLWAHDRAMMADILRYLEAGARRDAVRKSSDRFVNLVLIPSPFLTAKARDPVARKIRARLSTSPPR